MSESQQAGGPLSNRREQLDRHIAARFEDLFRGLHQRVGEQVRTANEKLLEWLETQAPELPTSFVEAFDLSSLTESDSEPAPPEDRRAVADVLAAVAAIDGETGQAEILTALLEQGLGFASQTAFFLVRSGQVRGWAGRGFEADVTPAFATTTDAAPWSELIAKKSAFALGSEDASSMGEALGSRAGTAFLVPFSIRGEIHGALWAAAEDDGDLDGPSLQLVTHAAAMALETASVSPGTSPALKLDGELPSRTPRAEGDESPTASEEPPAPRETAADEDDSEIGAETVASAAVVDAGDDRQQASESTRDESVDAVDQPATPPEDPEETAPRDREPAVEPPSADVQTLDEESSQIAVDEAPASPEPQAASGTREPADASSPGNQLPTEGEIALEAEPEPELEDTNIWEVEDEDDDDEPTYVGSTKAVSIDDEVADGSEEETGESMAMASPPAAPLGQETVRIDLETIKRDQEAAAARAAAASDPGDETSPTMHAVPAPPAVAPPPSSEPVEVPPPVEPSPTSFAEPPKPDFTDSTPQGFAPSPSSFAEPTPSPSPPASFATPPPQPEPPPEKSDVVSGSTEVVPPPDLDGPGLAFATPAPAEVEQKADDGDAALHEEARRLARLLVSEIKLYNEEIIEEGRRSGNIYERLKDDIDRSRQMYEERIDPRLADQEDYFYQELVQRLAGGEERLLGM